MNSRFRAGVIFLAFLLTGVGTAILGAALPAMLKEWRLSDSNGGLLVFACFAGSTSGVLLAGVAPRTMAGVGMACSAFALLLLSLVSHPPLVPCFFLYGAGLGTAMTSISLLRSREVPGSGASLEMNRLNLIWALGACVAPVLALHSLRLVSVGALFKGMSAVFVFAAAGLLFVNRRQAVPAARALPSLRMERLAPIRMWVFAGAAVGLETAIGSWLTTYTQRMVHGAAIAVTANSAFWFGLLLSRAAHSLRSGRRLESPLGLAAHLLAVAVALFLLIGAPLEALLPTAAFLAGLGLGPLYPLVLSWALPRYRSSAVFLLAGAASAVLPWLTGVISTAFRSLRAGLIAPCATVLVLIAAAISMRREISEPDQVPV